jgi:hypothetical protein
MNSLDNIQPTSFTLRKYLIPILIAPWILFPLIIVFLSMSIIVFDLDPLLVGNIFDFVYYNPFLILGFIGIYAGIFIGIAYMKISLSNTQKKLTKITQEL